MASTSCSVCMQDWSTNRPPHVLECGHSFCRLCISQLMTGTNAPECPFCHTLIKYSSIETIPKNYMLFNEEIRGEYNAVDADIETNSSEPLCTTHDLKLDKWCKTCKICVCSSCSSDDHSPHPPSKCNVIDLNLNDVIEASCDINAALVKRSQDIQKRMNQCNGFSINFIASINQEKKSLDQFQEATQNIKSYVKGVKSKLFSLTEELTEQVSLIGESVDTSEISIHFERQNKLKIEMENWMNRIVNELPLPTNVALKEIQGIMKELYAVIQMGDKILFGRIKINGDCMKIGSFKESCPPFNSKIIKLSEICSMEKFIQEKNVYLRVTGNGYDKTIYIKISSDYDTRYDAYVFFSLCCGLYGESYEGSQLIRFDHGLQISGNFNQRYKDYEMLEIYDGQVGSRLKRISFGIVQESLESVDYIYNNKLAVIISECGVILKC